MAKADKAKIEQDDEELGSILEFSEDISEAEAPEPLPEREYPATIVRAERKTSQKGSPYISTLFKINPDDYPADFDSANAPEGVNIVYNRLGTEDNINNRHKMRKFCTAIGAPMSKRIDLSEWTGCEAKVTIKHDEFEGVTRAIITKVEPID